MPCAQVLSDKQAAVWGFQCNDAWAKFLVGATGWKDVGVGLENVAVAFLVLKGFRTLHTTVVQWPIREAAMSRACTRLSCSSAAPPSAEQLQRYLGALAPLLLIPLPSNLSCSSHRLSGAVAGHLPAAAPSATSQQPPHMAEQTHAHSKRGQPPVDMDPQPHLREGVHERRGAAARTAPEVHHAWRNGGSGGSAWALGL